MRKFFLFALCFAGGVHASPVLNVYTYDSFASAWGPGPAVKVAFEKTCACELNFVAVDGSAGILSRVLLEGESSRADVVLGLDNTIIADARASDLLAEHNVALADLDLPVAWDDEIFLPFDYGYFAFVYDRERVANPPASFAELIADDDLTILIQDPRSSTPGLGLVLWVKQVYGDDAINVWRALREKIVTVTRGWSEAYGLFLDGEADMVLSYTTSPAYHLAGGDDRYRAARFADGHAMQVEVAAVLKRAPNRQLAQKFMHFIATDAFQSAIPTGNWMYPVRAQPLPAAFADLVQPSPVLLMDADAVAAGKRAWVDEFVTGLSD